MLVQWEWLSSFDSGCCDSRTNYHGLYQSDTSDLKAFMRRVSPFSGVRILHCLLQDGREYIWRNPKHFPKCGGWVSVT